MCITMYRLFVIHSCLVHDYSALSLEHRVGCIFQGLEVDSRSMVMNGICAARDKIGLQGNVQG